MSPYLPALLLVTTSTAALAGDVITKHRLGPTEFGERYAVTAAPTMPSDQTLSVLIAAGQSISQQRADLIGSGATPDGRAIFTGSRGGRYYHSAGGGRVYIK